MPKMIVGGDPHGNGGLEFVEITHVWFCDLAGMAGSHTFPDGTLSVGADLLAFFGKTADGKRVAAARTSQHYDHKPFNGRDLKNWTILDRDDDAGTEPTLEEQTESLTRAFQVMATKYSEEGLKHSDVATFDELQQWMMEHAHGHIGRMSATGHIVTEDGQSSGPVGEA